MVPSRREALAALGAAIAGNLVLDSAAAGPAVKPHDPLLITQKCLGENVHKLVYQKEDEISCDMFLSNLCNGKVLVPKRFTTRSFTFAICPFYGSEVMSLWLAGNWHWKKMPEKSASKTIVTLDGSDPYEVKHFSKILEFTTASGIVLARSVSLFLDRNITYDGIKHPV